MSNPDADAERRDDTLLSMPSNGVLEQDGTDDSLDTVFATLTSQRCRYAVYYLHQRGGVEVDELAELIAASENSGDRAAVTADEQEQVHVGLVHTHLPKLAAANVVEYDAAEQRVRLDEGIPRFWPHLAGAADVELP